MKPYGLKGKKGAGWPLSENIKSKKTSRQAGKKASQDVTNPYYLGDRGELDYSQWIN